MSTKRIKFFTVDLAKEIKLDNLEHENLKIICSARAGREWN